MTLTSKKSLDRKSKGQNRSQAHKADDKEQSKLFVEKAREIGAGDEQSASDQLLEQLAKMKPAPHKIKK